MNMPWHGRAGLARLTAIFATLLLVSLGLCGTNLVVSNLGAIQNSGALTTFVVATGIAELAGILVGIIGLLTVSVLAIFRAIYRRGSPSSEKEESE